MKEDRHKLGKREFDREIQDLWASGVPEERGSSFLEAMRIAGAAEAPPGLLEKLRRPVVAEKASRSFIPRFLPEKPWPIFAPALALLVLISILPPERAPLQVKQPEIVSEELSVVDFELDDLSGGLIVDILDEDLAMLGDIL